MAFRDIISCPEGSLEKRVKTFRQILIAHDGLEYGFSCLCLKVVEREPPAASSLRRVFGRGRKGWPDPHRYVLRRA